MILPTGLKNVSGRSNNFKLNNDLNVVASKAQSTSFMPNIESTIRRESLTMDADGYVVPIYRTEGIHNADGSLNVERLKRFSEQKRKKISQLTLTDDPSWLHSDSQNKKGHISIVEKIFNSTLRGPIFFTYYFVKALGVMVMKAGLEVVTLPIILVGKTIKNVTIELFADFNYGNKLDSINKRNRFLDMISGLPVRMIGAAFNIPRFMMAKSVEKLCRLFVVFLGSMRASLKSNSKDKNLFEYVLGRPLDTIIHFLLKISKIVVELLVEIHMTIVGFFYDLKSVENVHGLTATEIEEIKRNNPNLLEEINIVKYGNGILPNTFIDKIVYFPARMIRSTLELIGVILMLPIKICCLILGCVCFLYNLRDPDYFYNKWNEIIMMKVINSWAPLHIKIFGHYKGATHFQKELNYDDYGAYFDLEDYN